MVKFSNKYGRLAALFLLLTLLLLAFQQAVHSPPPATYLGMHTIDWVLSDGCSQGAAPRDLNAGRGAFGSFEVPRSSGSFRCQSAPLVPASRHIALSAAWGGSPDAVSKIKAVGANGRVYSELELAPRSEQQSREWERLVLTLPRNAPLTGLSIRLSGPEEGWVSVLSRADYLSAPLVRTEATLQRAHFLKQFVFAALAVVLAALLCCHGASIPRPVYFILLSTIAIGVHFRAHVYFQWDEWHAIQRFSELGLSGVVYTHNEHFLPFFFLLYYLEALLFGDFYPGFLLFSALLHAVNAFLLTLLLKKIGNGLPYSRAAARILGVTFAANALNSEALHWAFEQSLLIAQLLTLVSLHGLWHWVLNGNRRSLVWGVSACALAPLFFGNGFSAPLQLAPLGLIALFGSTHPREVILRQSKRVFVFIASCGLALSIPALLYYFNRHGAGHSIDEANPLAYPQAVLHYLFVGTGLGTVLRGTGAFPSLQFHGAAYARQLLEQKLPFLHSFPLGAETLFACFGFALLLLLLILALWSRPRRWGAVCFFAGFSIIVAALLLPALGRWAYGPIQSLALRYHYATLVGLAILSLPVFRSLLVCSGTHGRAAPLFRTLVMALLTGHFFVQFYVGATFNYFTSRGEINREYIQRLREWNIHRIHYNSAHFDMKGTPLEGLYPAMPPDLTPGRSADEIAETLHWLNPRKYPRISEDEE